MKKFLCLFLSVIMLLPILGCNKKDETLVHPVPFYYRRAELTYASSDSVIHAEQRESAGFADISILLQTYLQGPVSDEFAATFPSGTQLMSILFNGPVAELVISSQLSSLNELDRNIACACICMTVLALTDAQSVRIRVEGGITQQSYLFDMRNHEILLKDLAQAP